MIMKKVLYLILLFVIIVGIVGGLGYLIYYKAYPIAVFQFVADCFMYPTIKDIVKKLQN